jgi:hypothetical protein
MRRLIRHLGECGWFWVWTMMGALGMLGMISLGWLLLLPIALVSAGIERYAQPPQRTMLGLLSGAGVLFLVVAYINRNGPFNPHTWGTAGILCLIGGIVAYAVAAGRAHRTVGW